MKNTDQKSSVSNIFAQASGTNDWSPEKIYDLSESLCLSQDEILYESLDPVISKIIYELLNKSGQDGYGPEVGVILAYMQDGSIDTEFMSSDDREMIYSHHNDEALEQLLSRVEPENIERVQYYHTHGKGGLMSMTLSRMDVTETNRLQNTLLSKGIVCPFDMHAIPVELAYHGQFEVLGKPPLGPLPYDEDGNWIEASKRKPPPPEEKPTYIEIVPKILRTTLHPEQVIPDIDVENFLWHNSYN